MKLIILFFAFVKGYKLKENNQIINTNNITNLKGFENKLNKVEFFLNFTLFNQKYILYSSLVIVFSIIIVLSIILNKYIRKFIELKISTNDHININEDNLDEVLNYSNIQEYLFLDEECYFKRKYGDKFILENCDFILIKNEVLEMVLKNENNLNLSKTNSKDILRNGKRIKELYKEIKTQEYDNKLYNSLIGLRICIFSIFLITIALLINEIKKEPNFLRLVCYIFFFIILIVIILIYFASKEFQKEIKSEELLIKVKNIHLDGYSEKDLLVVDKVLSN